MYLLAPAVTTAARLGRTFFLVPLLLACVALGGCSWFQFPGVYRLTIQQGNIITQEMMDQLEPGMTRRQVNFILGTPLILDSFNPNRWDYIYTLRAPNGEVFDQRLTVYFDGDQLSHFTGDLEPSQPSAPVPTLEPEGEEAPEPTPFDPVDVEDPTDTGIPLD